MNKPRHDLSIFNRLDLEKPAIGVKFLPNKPKGVERLDKTMALCTMVAEAQERGVPFYAGKENENCVGGLPMGWIDPPPLALGGAMGCKWGLFEDARANARLYVDTPKFHQGVFRYIIFSPLDSLTFDPDLLFILATPSQAEIIFRAMLYVEGGRIESVTTNVLACAYLFPYPYFSGKVNYMVTGLAFGTKGRQTYPEGRLLITIPWNWISKIAENMAEMEWVLPAYTMEPEEFIATAAKYHEELRNEYEND